MFSDSSEVLKFIKDTDVKFLDIRFTDLPGVQQHFNIPASTVDEEFFTVGQLFDGSSIRGFASIHESDMQLIPDVSTAYVDPFRDASARSSWSSTSTTRATARSTRKDPRQVAKKAEKYLASTGIADTAFFAPEAEFYIFDDVRYEVKQNSSFYYGRLRRGRLEHRPRRRGRQPRQQDPVQGRLLPRHARSTSRPTCATTSALKLIEAGLILERAHHEVGTGGQAEINYRFDTMVHAADDILKFKYIVKNTAERVGQDGDVHAEAALRRQRLGHAHPPVAVERRQAAVLRRGGLRRPLRHRPLVHRRPAARTPRRVLAFTNPTVNSYHRLVPGFEAPVNLVYSAGNRSAAIRIPITGTNPKAKRIEFRAPDASGNPYLAFAAQLMAGLDGIKNRIEPHEPVDKDLYELPPEEAKNIPQVPGSLRGLARRPRGRPRVPARRAACSPRSSSRPGSTTSARRSSSPSRSVRTRSSTSCTSASDARTH